MKKKAKDLIFISRIKRDGSGTVPVSNELLDTVMNNPFSRNEQYKLTRLSITHDTYIASHFNVFVVKLKKNNLPLGR